MEVRLRFDCPSASLRLAMLSKRTHRILWPSLVLAVVIHLSFTQLVGRLGQERTAAKPLTTKFIKRQPRLTKPLEMKKRPRPKRRQIQRKMVAVKARERRERTSMGIQPVQVVGSLSRPKVQVGRVMGLDAMALEPEAIAQRIVGSREDKQVVDMTLEMVDVQALDTGKHHALVIQDPTDKRNITGFLHLALIYSKNMRNRAWHDFESRNAYAMTRLVAAVNKYTGIKADIAGRFTFDDEQFFRTPWVYAATHWSFQLTQSELANLGKYMMGGGLFMGDGGHQRLSIGGDVSMRQMFAAALALEGYELGVDWTFERLPNSHAIYHCFFEFPSGPPMSEDRHRTTGFDYLEGITIEGRLVGIMSNKAWGGPWGDWGRWPGYEHIDPTRGLQFGVNIIVFALTQEGSITQRVLDTVQ